MGYWRRSLREMLSAVQSFFLSYRAFAFEQNRGVKMAKNVKSRGCWAIGLCMRGDCANRGAKCDFCIRFDGYRRVKNEKTKVRK